MNQSAKSSPSHDDVSLDVRIQRCVDGESTDDDERRLLAQLEFQPEGWRRLALSFVEQRLLTTATRGLLASPPISVRNGTSAVRRPRRATGLLRWTALGLVTALAFGAGRWWSNPSNSRSADLPVAMDRDAASRSRQDSWEQPQGRENPPRMENAPPALDPAAEQRLPTTFVSLEVPGVAEELSVPVYQLPEDVSGWRPFLEAPERSGQFDQLRRAGYQVRASRLVVQVAADEKQSIWLPIETIQVQPARF